MQLDKHYIDFILRQFFIEVDYKAVQRKGGMNNYTYFVQTDNDKYVLRIYQTHQDIDKIKYEHEVLKELSKSKPEFGTPVSVKTMAGDTYARAEDGKLAALFCYMEGATPAFKDITQIKSFGFIAGRLSTVLNTVSIGLKPAYRPYYEIENTHPLCTVENLINFCNKPTAEFKVCYAELKELRDQLIRFQQSVPKLRALPHQLIHGDLNASNVLTDGEGRISAVLDFEFVTEDLRVMELCVCLSELINIDEARDLVWQKISAFIEGYGLNCRLTSEEVSVIPTLVMLRRLDVFIHFLGRYWDGIDSVDIVLEQLHKAAAQAKWIKANEVKLYDMCCSLN